MSVNTREAVKQFIINNELQYSPPLPNSMEALWPPPALPSPPPPPLSHEAASQFAALLQQYTPRDLRQWRQALVALSWAMMGMFAASSVLLLVEVGCEGNWIEGGREYWDNAPQVLLRAD